MANHLHLDALIDPALFDPMRSVEDFIHNLKLNCALRDCAAAAPIRLEVSETKLAYTVRAEMPGLKKEDIQIDIDGNLVSIAAETKRDHEVKEGATMLRSERYVGQQCRSFILAQEIDDAASTAAYHDGVLELTLPKRASESGKKKLVIS